MDATTNTHTIPCPSQPAHDTLALNDMANRINQEHQQAVRCAQQAIEHALNCGRLLLEVKSRLPHGEFLPWVKANCEVKERQAQNYMRVARNWKSIEAKNAPGADLTVKSALALLQLPAKKNRDLNADTQSAYRQAFDAAAELIWQEWAIGAILNWGDQHDKDPNDLSWLYDITQDELNDLLSDLGGHGVTAVVRMTDRATKHYGLSGSAFPHTLFIALANENGNHKTAERLAGELQQLLDAVGLDHAAAKRSQDQADAWLRSVTAELEDGDVEGLAERWLASMNGELAKSRRPKEVEPAEDAGMVV